MTIFDQRREQRQRAEDRRLRRAENVRFQAEVKVASGAADIEAWSDIEAELDELFSRWVRMRDERDHGRCRVCETGPIEVCYHVIPRGAHAIRWAEDNGWGACSKCNAGEQQARPHYKDVHRQIMGDEAYEALVARSRIVEPWDLAKLVALRDVLKNQIETFRP